MPVAAVAAIPTHMPACPSALGPSPLRPPLKPPAAPPPPHPTTPPPPTPHPPTHPGDLAAKLGQHCSAAPCCAHRLLSQRVDGPRRRRGRRTRQLQGGLKPLCGRGSASVACWGWRTGRAGSSCAEACSWARLTPVASCTCRACLHPAPPSQQPPLHPFACAPPPHAAGQAAV